MKELSELTVIFGGNFGAIHEAWEHFRHDISSFNAESYKMIKDVCKSESMEDKVEFYPLQNLPEKDGAWRNFYGNVTVNLNVKPSDFKVFRKEVAAIIFEIAFDEESSKFKYSVYFKNYNKLNNELDEMIFKNEELRARFQTTKKSDPNMVLFRLEELNSKILSTVRDDAVALLSNSKKLFAIS